MFYNKSGASYADNKGTSIFKQIFLNFFHGELINCSITRELHLVDKFSRISVMKFQKPFKTFRPVSWDFGEK